MADQRVTLFGKRLIQQWTSSSGVDQGLTGFFIVKCSISSSCRQIELLQALVNLLWCHFLNG